MPEWSRVGLFCGAGSCARVREYVHAGVGLCLRGRLRGRGAEFEFGALGDEGIAEARDGGDEEFEGRALHCGGIDDEGEAAALVLGIRGRRGGRVRCAPRHGAGAVSLCACSCAWRRTRPRGGVVRWARLPSWPPVTRDGGVIDRRGQGVMRAGALCWEKSTYFREPEGEGGGDADEVEGGEPRVWALPFALR